MKIFLYNIKTFSVNINIFSLWFYLNHKNSVWFEEYKDISHGTDSKTSYFILNSAPHWCAWASSGGCPKTVGLRMDMGDWEEDVRFCMTQFWTIVNILEWTNRWKISLLRSPYLCLSNKENLYKNDMKLYQAIYDQKMWINAVFNS